MDEKDLAKGLEGEKIIRQLLKEHNHEYGQIDLISIDKATGKIYLWEIKHQERFEGPPFDGHGLPPWQFYFRIKIAKKMGVTPMLVIVEPKQGLFDKQIILYQSLFVLQKLPPADVFKSKTGKRLIFNISKFKVFEQ